MSHIRSQSRHVRAMPTVSGSSPSYTGPLDLVPGAVLGWSQRALSAAFQNQADITIQRFEDSEILQFSLDEDEISAAEVEAWLVDDDGYLTQIVDQTGSGNTGISDGSNGGIQWVADAGNGHPGFQADGTTITNETLDCAAGARSFCVVFNYPIDSDIRIIQHSQGSFAMSLSTFYNNAGEFYLVATDGVNAFEAHTETTISPGLHVVQLSFAENGTPTIKVDGSAFVLTKDTGDYFALPQVTNSLLSFPSNTPAVTKVSELVIWPSANVDAAAAEMKSFYGIS